MSEFKQWSFAESQSCGGAESLPICYFAYLLFFSWFFAFTWGDLRISLKLDVKKHTTANDQLTTK
jgi:hypothetical protein